MKIEADIEKKYLYILATIFILGFLAMIVHAYSGNVGHTSNQIDEVDPTVATSVKDGVSWSELSGIPAGFADGVDNLGVTSASSRDVTSADACGSLGFLTATINCNAGEVMTGCSGYIGSSNTEDYKFDGAYKLSTNCIARAHITSGGTTSVCVRAQAICTTFNS